MHTHSVVDSGTRFILDPFTRKLSTDSTKKLLAQGDHRSKAFTFEVPRYIDGHDMSLCNSAQIHFTNTEGKQPKRSSSDVWEATDLELDGDAVTFSWIIENTATMYVGSLSFSLKLQCIGEDNIIDYEYNSAEYTKISIASAQSNTEQAVEESTSLLSSFKREVVAEAAEALRGAMSEYVAAAEGAVEEAREAVAQLTVDSYLNENSVNPIQNKAVVGALNQMKLDVGAAVEAFENEKGVSGGVATLDESGKVPSGQLPAMDYIPTNEKAQAGGVATLGTDGKIPSGQLPTMNYIPTSAYGNTYGVATLGGDGKIPSGQMPSDYATQSYVNQQIAAQITGALEGSY